MHKTRTNMQKNVCFVVVVVVGSGAPTIHFDRTPRIVSDAEINRVCESLHRYANALRNHYCADDDIIRRQLMHRIADNAEKLALRIASDAFADEDHEDH